MPLPTPVTAAGASGLAAILAAPRRAVLAFDYDGVLAPIVDDPERAWPDPRALAGLARLAPLVAGLAIITGRAASIVVSLGGLVDHPDLDRLTVFGHYGRERWDARTRRVAAPPPSASVEVARTELAELLAEAGLASTVWLEDKGSAVAVHTRRSPDPAGMLERLRPPVVDLAARLGLVVEPGRMVLEVRPPGADKGQALRIFAGETGAAAVAYAGDDLGDLSAFAAVDALSAEGVPGLKVCSGAPEGAPEVARQADLVVPGPAGVADFLRDLADHLDPSFPGRSA